MKLKALIAPVVVALALVGWFALGASASDNAPASAPAPAKAAATAPAQPQAAVDSDTPVYKGDWHLVR